MKGAQSRSGRRDGGTGRGGRGQRLGPIYRAHLGGDEIAEPIEPLDVRLKISRLLHVLERRLDLRVLLGEGLDKFLGPDERQPLQFDVGQLLSQLQWRRAHLRHIGLHC